MDKEHVCSRNLVLVDNQAAIKMAYNQQSTQRTKHMDLRLQFVKEKCADQTIELQYVDTTMNEADAFTKPLPRPSFERLTASWFQ